MACVTVLHQHGSTSITVRDTHHEDGHELLPNYGEEPYQSRWIAQVHGCIIEVHSNTRCMPCTFQAEAIMQNIIDLVAIPGLAMGLYCIGLAVRCALRFAAT